MHDQLTNYIENIQQMFLNLIMIITAIFIYPQNSSENFLDVASVQKCKLRTLKAFRFFNNHTMSKSPECQDDELPESFETRVIAQLAIYSASKGTKGKIKESKAQKTKELVFIFSANNYVEFGLGTSSP